MPFVLIGREPGACARRCTRAAGQGGRGEALPTPGSALGAAGTAACTPSMPMRGTARQARTKPEAGRAGEAGLIYFQDTLRQQGRKVL